MKSVQLLELREVAELRRDSASKIIRVQPPESDDEERNQ